MADDPAQQPAPQASGAMTFDDWLHAFMAVAADPVWSAYGGDEKRLERLWADDFSPQDGAAVLSAELEDDDA